MTEQFEWQNFVWRWDWNRRRSFEAALMLGGGFVPAAPPAWCFSYRALTAAIIALSAVYWPSLMRPSERLTGDNPTTARRVYNRPRFATNAINSGMSRRAVSFKHRRLFSKVEKEPDLLLVPKQRFYQQHFFSSQLANEFVYDSICS